MDLVLIRHGLTDYNEQRRWQGRVDVPLNATGRALAVRIRDFLHAEKIVAGCIYTSPLVRSAETAKIIGTETCTITEDQRLIEIDLGDYDGLFEDDISRQVGEEKYQQWRSQNFLIPAPNGESFAQLRTRVGEFLVRIEEQHKDSRVMIVAHQGVFVALKSVISNNTEPDVLEGYKQKNSEIEVWNTATRRCESRWEVS